MLLLILLIVLAFLQYSKIIFSALIDIYLLLMTSAPPIIEKF